jgi:hypothetical protein
MAQSGERLGDAVPDCATLHPGYEGNSAAERNPGGSCALLRAAFRKTRSEQPFAIDAIVVLPGHLHANVVPTTFISIRSSMDWCYRQRRGHFPRCIDTSAPVCWPKTGEALVLRMRITSISVNAAIEPGLRHRARDRATRWLHPGYD